MSLESNVLKYGAKGAVLDYIKKNAPKIPIEPFVLVPVGADWRDYQTQINDLGDCLVRSSSPLEDGQEISFAGLFSTDQFDGQSSIDRVMESLTDENTLRYAQIHQVTNPLTMGLVFQKDSKAEWNWGMVRHPHLEHILFIMGNPFPDYDQYSENLVYNEKNGKLQEVIDYCSSKESKFKDMPKGIEEAIQIYREIETLPAFQTGFSYHMEFGTKPTSIYQFRPFKRKQKPTWEINFQELKKLEKNHGMCRFRISFGITGENGLDLKVARALCVYNHEEHVERYKNEFAGRPSEEIVRNLLKGWNLSSSERVYAEELAQMNKYSSVYATFDKAVERINNQVKKDETCLYQEGVHLYYGRDIDLSFPNARAWIPHGGIQFLSHNWFRALQSYEFNLLGSGSNLIGRTGDSVRIISDGNFGVVIENI